MARIRSVKPELRRDMTVAGWPREIRYAWVLLWGYLDDSGRGIDDLRLLVADLFPLDRDVTEHKLDTWLQTMATPSIHGAPVICRYEVNGLAYLHAPKWSRSQRVSHPQASRVPVCPYHDSEGNDSGLAPEPVPNQNGAGPDVFQTSHAPEGQGVKGSRGQGNAGASEFASWWQVYPRHTAKVPAERAYVAARKDVSAEDLLAGAVRYRDNRDRKEADPKFTAHASTWLHQKRWTDEPERRSNGRPQSGEPGYDPHKEHLLYR